MSNFLKMTAYSESMKKGNVVITTQPSDKDWTYISPYTISETECKVACRKK